MVVYDCPKVIRYGCNLAVDFYLWALLLFEASEERTPDFYFEVRVRSLPKVVAKWFPYLYGSLVAANLAGLYFLSISPSLSSSLVSILNFIIIF